MADELKQQKTLKPKQRLLAELMAFQPELTNAEYAQQIGIDEKTLYRWKKEEIFLDYLHKICKEKFKDLERMAIQKLGERVEAGAMDAILYVLNNVGYKVEDNVNVNANGITLNVTVTDD
jgi:hypothetical protein